MCLFFRAVALGVLLSSAVDTSVQFERTVLRQAFSHAGASVAAGAVSLDGRFVAFVSMARLLPSDRNSVEDVYVLDRETHAVTLETCAVDGASSNGSSAHPHLSGDGRYLVFVSLATNLTSGRDQNELQDIFVRDRLGGTTRRVSIGRTGEDANGRSETPAISADGRFVTFASSATNLVPGEDGNALGIDVYVVSLSTGGTTRVSVDTAGHPYAAAFAPRLSGDGRLVVFTAADRTSERAQSGPSLTASGRYAVYVRDTAAGVTTCISCDANTAMRQPAFAPDISVDGRIVVFTVLTGPHPQRTDIAVHDRSTSATTVITRRANARSRVPRLSGDGRTIVFESWASDLRCEGRCSEEGIDDNLLADVYLFDRATSRFRRASGADRSWWSPSHAPSIDERGRTVVFSSRQPFGPEDDTIDFDLYVCDPACE